ncbi:MAG TPA: cytochrome B [Bacteroidales bacterium]|nr:cytochrome B [Bacteroidales bacterium]
MLVISNPKKAYTYAFLSTAIAVLGAAVGYAIGHYAWLSSSSEPTAIANFFFTYVPGFNAEAYTHIQGLYQQWGFLIIFTAGFAPVPFELITITSGVFNINFVLFLIGAAIGRGIRYFVIAFFIVRYGRKFVLFVKKYTKPIIWGVSATAIVAIIIVKMFL